MQVINWLNLQPQQTDLETLEKNISEPLPAREVRQNLIEITLQDYPWEDLKSRNELHRIISNK